MLKTPVKIAESEVAAFAQALSDECPAHAAAQRPHDRDDEVGPTAIGFRCSMNVAGAQYPRVRKRPQARVWFQRCQRTRRRK